MLARKNLWTHACDRRVTDQHSIKRAAIPNHLLQTRYSAYQVQRSVVFSAPGDCRSGLVAYPYSTPKLSLRNLNTRVRSHPTSRELQLKRPAWPDWGPLGDDWSAGME